MVTKDLINTMHVQNHAKQSANEKHAIVYKRSRVPTQSFMVSTDRLLMPSILNSTIAITKKNSMTRPVAVNPSKEYKQQSHGGLDGKSGSSCPRRASLYHTSKRGERGPAGMPVPV